MVLLLEVSNDETWYLGAIVDFPRLFWGELGERGDNFQRRLFDKHVEFGSAAAPTATSTNYEVLSTKNATTSSIASGSLQLNMGTTSSGFAELEALFKSSPVALTQTGDFVQATVEFTSTAVNLSGSTSTLNIGLYNSHGAGPVPGATMNNARSWTTIRGAIQQAMPPGWEGYVGRIGATTAASSQIYTRPAQVGETSNEAQDGLFNNAGGGAYDNPSGVSVKTGGAGADLVDGTAYSLWLRATYDAGTGFVTMAYELSDANGIIDSVSGPTDASNTVATAFDALALGIRGTGTGPYSLNIRSLKVDSNVSMVPEPASLITFAFAAVALGLSRKRRR